MDELNKVLGIYNIDLSQYRHMPVEIPGVDREQLAQLFCALGYQIGVEVGTEAGTYAEILCRHNPALKLFCIDMWTVYPGYRDYNRSPRNLANSYHQAVERLKPYDVTLVRKFSMDAVRDFDDESLDFVYIDANHEWPFITQDIYYWAKKVKVGGIVSGHDYYQSGKKDSRCHVMSAVGGYCHAFFVKPWFVMGLKHERTSRSWFWVKL